MPLPYSLPHPYPSPALSPVTRHPSTIAHTHHRHPHHHPSPALSPVITHRPHRHWSPVAHRPYPSSPSTPSPVTHRPSPIPIIVICSVTCRLYRQPHQYIHCDPRSIPSTQPTHYGYLNNGLTISTSPYCWGFHTRGGSCIYADPWPGAWLRPHH